LSLLAGVGVNAFQEAAATLVTISAQRIIPMDEPLSNDYIASTLTRSDDVFDMRCCYAANYSSAA